MTIPELINDLRDRCEKAVEEGRPFEDLFSAFQSEMIRQSIALSENRAEKIFLYSDFEDGAVIAKPLFRIGGEYYTEHELQKAITDGKIPSSLSKQERDDIEWTIIIYSTAVRRLCRYYGKDIPTVIKIIYDAKTRQVRAKYSYERLKSVSEDDDDIRCRTWFDEIRAKNL